ncbi:hypothetical protein [Mycobacterium sp.]|uniref:hypothetical protein n=1 Tax=Mycobacterium sp. TaxID=1785 RepID=UPI0031CF659A
MWCDEIAGRLSMLDIGLDIGIDNTTGAELTDVQVRGRLEPDNHITIRLPPLSADIRGQLLGTRARRDIRVGADLLVVVHTEGNDVFVRSQKAVSRQ